MLCDIGLEGSGDVQCVHMHVVVEVDTGDV